MILAVTPAGGLPQFRFPVPHLDKLFHFFEFALLYALASYAFMRNRYPAVKTHAIRWGLSYAAFFGIITEFAQNVVPGRQFDLIDMSVNILGALACAWVYRARSHRS